MRVLIVDDDPHAARQWRDAVASELPEAIVEIWHTALAHEADYGIGSSALPGHFFEGQPQLKAFFSTGAGVDRILASPGLPATLPVVRLEYAGMGTQLVSYCISEVLHWLRKRDAYDEQQRAREWRQLPAEEIDDWSIGVFGLGILGRQVAAAFASLGFSVNGYARSVHAEPGITCFSEAGGADGFRTFMRASRVLILVAPLTSATADRFDRASLALLPRSAYVINVARGGLLIDEALAELLDAGHIAGAALDVFREEPLPQDHSFWTHPRIRITPHVSGMAPIITSARQIAGKIRCLEIAEPISGVVDRGAGY